MKSSLLKGLTDEEKGDIKGVFKASILLRTTLVRVLEEENALLTEEMLEEDNYLQPEWKLSQVAKISQIKANKRLITFLV